MKWFGSERLAPFNAFEWYHIIMVLVYVFGFISLLIYGSKITKKKRLSNIIRWVLFVILVCSELSYQAWGSLNNSWNVREYLPFQLCSIAGILTMIALFTKKHNLIQIVFFIGVVPSFLAVITPELYYGFPHFRFWQFFIHHIALSWACIFLIVTTPLTISFKDMFQSYLYLLGYAALVGFVINPLFKANFLFLARIPSANTPLSLLGDGIWYYINLCSVGFIVFIALYYIHKVFIMKVQSFN
ncbi:YwaF family protein [Ornithinibacillus halotolerans]|uniref:Permease n=1 Tax=Ornithinibacillus halotolerans TaxID=1274357 RepID=A0A916W901_9BACI|nr:TIGR02206 family membrane protein [Ornithinibacillus halotolerans]GGA78807.1 permease [Ornithinibacillus halotolerans]